VSKTRFPVVQTAPDDAYILYSEFRKKVFYFGDMVSHKM